MGLLELLFGKKDDKKRKSSYDWSEDASKRNDDYYDQMRRDEPWKYNGIKRDQDTYLDRRDQR